MLATLCMRKVGSVILMNCQAKTTLEASDVVLEEVGILVYEAQVISIRDIDRSETRETHRDQ